MKKLQYSLGLVLLCILALSVLLVQNLQSQSTTDSEPSRLAVLWTSGDPEVAERVCLMYTHGAKSARWFEEVNLIVWGPSARLLAADKDLQSKVQAMMEDGVAVQACVVCADSYGVSGRLRELGLEVKAMGQPLTGYLKQDWKVLTF